MKRKIKISAIALAAVLALVVWRIMSIYVNDTPERREIALANVVDWHGCMDCLTVFGKVPSKSFLRKLSPYCAEHLKEQICKEDDLKTNINAIERLIFSKGYKVNLSKRSPHMFLAAKFVLKEIADGEAYRIAEEDSVHFHTWMQVK